MLFFYMNLTNAGNACFSHFILNQAQYNTFIPTLKQEQNEKSKSAWTFSTLVPQANNNVEKKTTK